MKARIQKLFNPSFESAGIRWLYARVPVNPSLPVLWRSLLRCVSLEAENKLEADSDEMWRVSVWNSWMAGQDTRLLLRRVLGSKQLCKGAEEDEGMQVEGWSADTATHPRAGGIGDWRRNDKGQQWEKSYRELILHLPGALHKQYKFYWPVHKSWSSSQFSYF